MISGMSDLPRKPTRRLAAICESHVIEAEVMNGQTALHHACREAARRIDEEAGLGYLSHDQHRRILAAIIYDEMRKATTL